MNVKQLKETLASFPDDMEVVGWSGEDHEAFKIIEVKQQNLNEEGYTYNRYDVVTIELYFH